MKATAVRTPREKALAAGISAAAGSGTPVASSGTGPAPSKPAAGTVAPRPAPRRTQPRKTAPRKAAPAPAPSTVEHPEPASGNSTVDSPAPASPGTGLRAPRLPGWTDDGAGFILALLLWGWVALPLLSGGPAAVKAMLLAKFLNKTSGKAGAA